MFNRRKFRSTKRKQLVTYDQFEPKMLLSATGNLDALQQQAILDFVASQADTAYLQFGASDLEFAAVESNRSATTILLQQTLSSIPIRNAYISVVQDPDGKMEVYDRGHQKIDISDDTRPSIGQRGAEYIANNSRSDSANSELVWLVDDGQAQLAWEVFTFESSNLSGENSEADYYSIVDAETGNILEQDTPGTVIEDLLRVPETMVGIHPRIVINNTIGAAGSRAYAAPFDAVVSLGGCTGTLIDANTVLTARHCGVGPGTQVRFGDNSNSPTLVRSVVSATNPGGGNANSPLLNGGDVTIANLNASVPANIASPMRLIAETNSLVGEVGGLHGYGFNGLGSNGHGFSADGFRWGGENIIDRYGSPANAGGSNIFSTDFDNGSSSNNTIGGSSPVPLEFEATTAPGDSGGPLLVQVGSEWVIAGVLSGGTTNTSVYGDISWWTGIAQFQSQIEAAGGEFTTGEFEGDIGPESFNIIRGVQTGGNLAALQTSNDIDLEILRDPKLSDEVPPIQFEITSTLPLDDPSQLEFRIESSSNSANVVQLVEAFNHTLGQYQLLSFEDVSYETDAVTDVSLSPSSFFVEAGTGAVSTRVTYVTTGLVFFQDWSVDVDQAAWIVNGGENPTPGPDGGDDGSRSIDLDLTAYVQRSPEIVSPILETTFEPPTLLAPLNTLAKTRSVIDRKPLTDRMFESANSDLEFTLDEIEIEEYEIDVVDFEYLKKLI